MGVIRWWRHRIRQWLRCRQGKHAWMYMGGDVTWFSLDSGEMTREMLPLTRECMYCKNTREAVAKDAPWE